MLVVIKMMFFNSFMSQSMKKNQLCVLFQAFSPITGVKMYYTKT